MKRINVFSLVFQQPVRVGGPAEKAIVIPIPLEIPERDGESLRRELSLEDKFVFGFHQRDDDGIWSPMQLSAFKDIECETNFFLVLGGGEKYKLQAKALGIKNITFLPHTASQTSIHRFLATLNVFAHGRSDGEQCSAAIAEALSHGLPIISHSAISNGHREQIGDAGFFVDNLDQYVTAMKKIQLDEVLYVNLANNARVIFESQYNLASVIDRYIDLYFGLMNAKIHEANRVSGTLPEKPIIKDFQFPSSIGSNLRQSKISIALSGWLHPKNAIGLNLLAAEGAIEFRSVFSLYKDADLVDADFHLLTEKFSANALKGRRGQIVGPHVEMTNQGVFSQIIKSNASFNCLSDWVKLAHRFLYPELNCLTLPFPVDLERFTPDRKVGKPIIYIKHRSANDVRTLREKVDFDKFLVFDYNKRYEEDHFRRSIAQAPFAVWLGCHESQGFAFQETLASGTPILVCDVDSIDDYSPLPDNFSTIPRHLPATSAPHFSDSCGILTTVEDVSQAMTLFLSRLRLFNPRIFIEQNLSARNLSKKWTHELLGVEFTCNVGNHPVSRRADYIL